MILKLFSNKDISFKYFLIYPGTNTLANPKYIVYQSKKLNNNWSNIIMGELNATLKNFIIF